MVAVTAFSNVSFTSWGSPCGANRPNQTEMSRSPKGGVSAMAGMPGMKETRLDEATASRRSLPASACGARLGMVLKRMGTWLPRPSLTAGAQPL